jgi:Hypothetical glycosyl hydrolase 6
MGSPNPMDRRTFEKTIVAGFGLLGGREAVAGPAAQPQPAASAKAKWPQGAYRRVLVDTHVPDWDPRLLASFDAARYVDTIARAGFNSVMQYANSHVGLCLWQTKIGHVHGALKGRDFFGEVMAECSRRGLHRVAYYSLIFDMWAFDTHPDWRIQPDNGAEEFFKGRTGTVCPNSPYRNHAMACVRELTSKYDFDGIFLDMTFWPAVCYCPHCVERYRVEHGVEPPRLVDWADPEWRRFQKSRETWMLDFAHRITDTIHSVRPVTVTHQSALIFQDWRFGAPLELRDASDYVGGDFYGGPTQYSLVCKAYSSLTKTTPFEFYTSRTIDLHDFESVKPLDELKVSAAVATIHSAASLLIDAIRPDGTLNEAAYDYMAKVNAFTRPYEPFLGGDLQADVAIYYDKASNYDPDDHGVVVSKAGTRHPHLDAVIGMAGLLRENHIPWGVVTNVNLEQLVHYRAVILSDIREMTPDQAARVREFVANGGVLYASGVTSLDPVSGANPRLLLEDVLGVQFQGFLGTTCTYLTPADAQLRAAILPQQNVTFRGKMVKVAAQPGTEVLATITLPFVAPEEGNHFNRRFAQIWSDPPALEPGTDPGIVVHRFGKGVAIWVAAPVESSDHVINRRLVAGLIRRFVPGPLAFELDAAPWVEMTLMRQASANRLLASLLNLQNQTPPVPVAATVRVCAPEGKSIRALRRLPGNDTVPFAMKGPFAEFRVPEFAELAMYLLDYA